MILKGPAWVAHRIELIHIRARRKTAFVAVTLELARVHTKDERISIEGNCARLVHKNVRGQRSERFIGVVSSDEPAQPDEPQTFIG